MTGFNISKREVSMTARKKGRGGVRPGAGRKALVPEERRRNRIMLAFTDAELAAITNAARGESVSGFLRGLALRFLHRRLH